MVLDESGRVSEIHSTDQACGGSDTVSVGAGDAVVFGGGGNDRLLDSLSTLTPDAAHRWHVLVGDNGRATLADGRVIEVTTTDFLAADDPLTKSDQIVGGERAEIILGGNHADNLQGGGGDDLILGDNGRVAFLDPDDPEGAGRIVAVENPLLPATVAAPTRSRAAPAMTRSTASMVTTRSSSSVTRWATTGCSRTAQTPALSMTCMIYWTSRI